MGEINTFNSAERLFNVVEKLQKVKNGTVTWQAYNQVCPLGGTKEDAFLFAYELAKLTKLLKTPLQTTRKFQANY